MSRRGQRSTEVVSGPRESSASRHAAHSPRNTSGSKGSPEDLFREVVRRRLAGEVGAIRSEGPFPTALVYPSPYAAGMSSLGYQRIYRALGEASGLGCERAFLPEDDAPNKSNGGLRTYESLRPVGDFPVVALSVAYELELAGLVRVLELSGLPVLREERDERHPFVLAGGPLTFSNPTPLGAFVDAVVMGEGETLAVDVVRLLSQVSSKVERLAALARMPHVWVPEHHGARLPSLAQIDDALLPAWGPIRSPEAELSDMFMIETSRGCSRGCTYCVMRRSTNGGMRIVPEEEILGRIPPDARRVGLVGAAVSDHPRITSIVSTLADQGREVGLSSLRPDKLKPEFVQALRRAGYRTLTTAMDGPSERVRKLLDRRAEERHLITAAQNARAAGMDRLKLYLMLGLPTEMESDVDECVRFVTELSRILPIALGIAPFCPKRNTPMAHAHFGGTESAGEDHGFSSIRTIEQRLERLRTGLRGRADVRSISARWAWVEAVLAKGGEAEGRAVLAAVRAGGRFSDYRRAFGDLPRSTTRTDLPLLVMQ